jgi:ribosome biogenesis GTPase
LNLIDYGFTPTMLPETMPEDTGIIPARITTVHRERYELVCEQGHIYGRLKAGVYYAGGLEAFPTTGDFVLVNYNPSGDSQIVKTLARKSFFSRLDPTPGMGEQVVAANFDYVFIMQSLNHDFNLRRLERYVTLAWQSGALPVIILTKADLVDDCSQQLQAAQKVAPGVAVHAISVVDGYGLDALNEYLMPCKTIVFIGSSGVGKSTLVNALAGQEIMAVQEIREDDSKGRHTTTRRQLIMLPSGAMIIDTPGMRELGMWDVSTGLGEAFVDVERYFGQCRFTDCRHQAEPGCAVRAAIASGELPRERWESYLKLKREARFAEDKAEYLRQKEQWAKGIAKWCKQMQKQGGFRK